MHPLPQQLMLLQRICAGAPACQIPPAHAALAAVARHSVWSWAAVALLSWMLPWWNHQEASTASALLVLRCCRMPLPWWPLPCQPAAHSSSAQYCPVSVSGLSLSANCSRPVSLRMGRL